MKINNYSSQIQFAEPIQNKTSKFNKEEFFSHTQDSVSISAEASALAKKMYAKERSESTQYTEKSINEMNLNATNPKAKNTKSTFSLSDLYSSYFLPFGEEEDDDDKSAGASSSSPAENIQKQIDAIEKQIKKLQGQIEQVATSDAPEIVKESKINALEKQIDGLSSQLTSLKSSIKTGASSNPFMALK